MLGICSNSQKQKTHVDGETLGYVNVQRGIFQNDYLSMLLFAIPLRLILRNRKTSRDFGID